MTKSLKEWFARLLCNHDYIYLGKHTRIKYTCSDWFSTVEMYQCNKCGKLKKQVIDTLHTINISDNTILYDYVNQIYVTSSVSMMYSRDIKVIFNRKEDAQAVIDNTNFREILDMVYKN